MIHRGLWLGDKHRVPRTVQRDHFELLLDWPAFEEQLHDGYNHVDDRPCRCQHNEREDDYFFLLFARGLEQKFAAEIVKFSGFAVGRRRKTAPVAEPRSEETIRQGKPPIPGRELTGRFHIL